MGMGYAGACADVIDVSFIREQCSKELEAFFDTFDPDNDTDLGRQCIEQFAQEYDYQGFSDSDMEKIKDMLDAMDALKKAFLEKTGLILSISYHDSEDGGDRYDDVSGVFWYVENAQQYSEAGKMWKDKIQHLHWVTFG